MSKWKRFSREAAVLALLGVACFVLMAGTSVIMTSVGQGSQVWAQTTAPPTYDQWKASSEAKDLNGDGVVNEADYNIFLGPPPPTDGGDNPPPPPTDGDNPPAPPTFDQWKTSPEAKDLNGDGVVNEADYNIFLGPPPPTDGGDNPPPPPTDGDNPPPPPADGDNPPPGPPTFDQWKSSPEAKDLNGDGVINEVDYSLFLGPPPSDGGDNPPPPPTDGDNPPPGPPTFDQWKSSPEAKDLNGDGVINEADYGIFLGPPPTDGGDNPPPPPTDGDNPPPMPTFDQWKTSPEARDLNGDGVIDEADYRLFFAPPPGDGGDNPPPMPTFDQWKTSPEAKDLNGDGDINEADYSIFLGSPPPPDGGDNPPPMPTFDHWKNSPEAKDLNNDGAIDEADFGIFLANQPPPGGDGPLPPGGPLLDALKRAEAQLRDAAPDFKVAIGPLLEILPDDAARDVLRGFAGDDLMLSMEEVVRAIDELSGGPDGPFPPGGDGLLPEPLRVLLEGLQAQLAQLPELSTVAIEPLLEQLAAQVDRDMLKGIAGDDGLLDLGEVVGALSGGSEGPGGPPPPGGDLPPEIVALIDALKTVAEQIRTSEIADLKVAIGPILDQIPAEAQGLLRDIAGDDLMLSMEEVMKGMQELSGGPDGPPPPGGDLPPEIMALIEVLRGIEDQIQTSEIPDFTVAIGPALEQLPADAQALLRDIAGDDLMLSMDEVMKGIQELSGGPDGPHPPPGGDLPPEIMALIEVLRGIEDQIQTSEIPDFTVAIGPALEQLPTDAQELLRGIAGDDLMLSMDEVMKGLQELSGGPDGPHPPPGGDLPPEIMALIEVLRGIEDQIQTSEIPDFTVAIGPALEQLPADAQELLRGIAGDDLMLSMDEVMKGIQELSGGPDGPLPPGGDLPPEIVALVEVLRGIEDQIKTSEIPDFTVAIGPALEQLPADAQELLRGIAGDDLMLSMEEVMKGLQELSGGPDGPLPPGGDLPPEIVALIEVLRGIEDQIRTSEIPDFTVAIGPALEQLPADAQELLRGIAGDDLMLSMDEVMKGLLELSGGPDGPPVEPPGEILLTGTFAEGVLTLSMNLPGVGELTIPLQMSDSGRELAGTAQSSVGPVEAELNRVAGEGVASVAGEWAAEILGFRLKIGLEQDGEQVRGSAFAEQSGPGPIPDGDAITGKIVEIDPEALRFMVEVGPDMVETVQVLDDTRIYFVPNPLGGDMGPGMPGSGALGKQAGPGLPGGDMIPGEMLAEFSDLEVGEDVIIVGERDETSGIILAREIGIVQPGDFPPMGPRPVAKGIVSAVDLENGNFTVETDDGEVTVEVVDHTEFFIRLAGMPGPMGPEMPPATGGPNMSTLGQMQPSQADGPEDPTGFVPGGSEGRVVFEDLQPDDEVEIFGHLDDDTGSIVADVVLILKSFEDRPGLDFPIVVGRVVDIDQEEGAFVIDEGFGIKTSITVSEKTEFSIVRPMEFMDPGMQPPVGGDPGQGDPSAGQAPDGPQPGPGDPMGPPPEEPASFADLTEDDNVDVFGEFSEENEGVNATKVLIFRGEELEEPVVVGKITGVDEGSITVAHEKTGEAWTVLLSDETKVLEIMGAVGPQEGPLPGGGMMPPTGNTPPGKDKNTGNGQGAAKQVISPMPEPMPMEEPREISDLAEGMYVAVFGEVVEEMTVEADRVLILYGGAVQEPLQFAAKVEFFDQFGGLLHFQSPQKIRVLAETEILLPDGEALESLADLKGYLGDSFGALLRIYLADVDGEAQALTIRVLVAPDGEIIEPPAIAVGEPVPTLMIVEDPRAQILDRDGVILPSARPPVKVTRNTSILWPDGSAANPDDLAPGTRVEITGVRTIGPAGLSDVADLVQIQGGRPFHTEGPVAEVDETNRVITLGTPPPMVVDPRAKVGDVRGKRIRIEELKDAIDADPGLQIVVMLNKYGQGIIELGILDPEKPRPPKQDEMVFGAEGVTIAMDADGRWTLEFLAPPPIVVPEGTPVEGGPGDLAGLLGEHVVIEGEALGQTLEARHILVVKQLDVAHLRIEVGDFDGTGAENDVQFTVVDDADAEIILPFRLFLNNFRPEDVESGVVKFDLKQRMHKVRVEFPDIPGLRIQEQFMIRDKAPELAVVSMSPVDGTSGVDTGPTTVSVTFNSEIEKIGRFINVTAFLRPAFNGNVPPGQMSIDPEDPMTVLIDADLQESTTYTLTVVQAKGTNRQALRRPVSATFSTGGTIAALGGVSGTVSLEPRAAAKQADGDEAIEILSGETIAVNSDGKEVGRGAVETDGSFTVENLPEGAYLLFANLETTTGRTSGSHDVDGDGLPDDVDVVGGDTISGLAITALEPLVIEAPILPDDDELPAAMEDSPISVDLDVTSGNQGLDLADADPAVDIDMAVYLEGAEGLAGFDVLVEYDPTALVFLGVNDGTDEEVNLLKSNGGFALGLTSPGGSSVNWSSVLLGPAETQLGQGDGLLGIFRFGLNETFFGTTEIVVSQVVLEGTAGTTVIQPFVRAQIGGEGVTKQIVATASKDTIESDGVETSTLTVKLYDLDGIAFDDDSASEVTFQVVSGDGTVDGEDSVTLPVTDGVATVTFTATGGGSIEVRATAEGASSVAIVVEATEPPKPGEGPVGPMALDLDTTAGDQEMRQTSTPPEVGDQIVMEILATEGALGLQGYQLTLAFDDSQLGYVSFSPSGLFDGALPIPTTGDDVARLSVALLGSTTTTEASGTIGQVTFEVLEGFSGETRVTLATGQFATPEETTKLTIGSGGALIVVGGKSASGEANPDFDGDGTVGFLDFIAFAQVYGAKQGDANYSSAYDLNGDGDLGFLDFIQFAQSYGKPVSGQRRGGLAKPLGSSAPGVNRTTEVSLASAPGGIENEVVVTVGLSDAVRVAGYSLTLDYDASALAFLGIEGSAASGISQDGQVALVKDSAGEVILADMLDAGSAIEGEGVLVQLRFQLLDPTVSGRVEIADALVSDGSGGVNGLLGALTADVRSLPEGFGLGQNYPNPFNPDTQIRYQLPESGEVSLVVYNLLGQEVRVLVQERQEAGFYRAVWDGRDALGRSVSSGVYLTRMVSGSFSSVKKMLLLK
jgi:hypothetical protein